MNQFVYINKDYQYERGIIHQYEAGILENKKLLTAIVTFVYSNCTIELSLEDITFFNPLNTGDQYSKKLCNVCHRLLDVNLFQKNQNGKNNRTVRRPSCNDCRKIIDGKDMTAAEKNEMEKIKPYMQIWTCPICKKTTIPGLTSKVVCDHDHITGHPRAWICDSCNTGLGRFKDDVKLLKSAIDYLETVNNTLTKK